MAYVFFPPVAGDGSSGGSSIVLPWKEGAYPMGATQPIVTKSPHISWDWNADPDDPWILDQTYLKFLWTSTQESGSVNRGAHVAVGQFLNIVSTGNWNLTFRVRVKVNNTARLSYVILHIGDLVSGFAEDDTVLSSISNDTWYLASLAQNMNGWSPLIRVSVTARGTDNANNVGLTEFSVGGLQIDW